MAQKSKNQTVKFKAPLKFHFCRELYYREPSPLISEVVSTVFSLNNENVKNLPQWASLSRPDFIS